MYGKWLFIFVIFSLFISCTVPEQIEDDIILIVSPRNDWNYYENRILQLSLNIRSSNINWYSDFDGFLGNGNGIFVNLRKGFHTIEAHYNENVYTVLIEVKQDTVEYLEERRYLISQNETRLNMNNGKWYNSIISLDSTILSFKYDNPFPKQVMAQSSIYTNNIMRDFHIPVENINELKIPVNYSRAAVSRRYNIGERKNLFVLNTNDPGSYPHEILAEMIHSGERYTIWKDYFEDIDAEALAICIANLDNIIMSRLLNIWGEWTDIDGDGKVAIMFSKTINEEKATTGFFYPKDMFLFVDDPAFPSYNPDSNEMDIVYIGYPIMEDPNYNPNSISATIAHEITHVITFSQKTYNKLHTGGGNINRETVFLEEGWSHLSEILCGFGQSGGNIMFLKKFFDDTSIYSFCSLNAMGEIDSMGMRGAISLFFSWLFWKQGGMDWHESIPGIVYDKGGISFLRRLINSDTIGWPSIGQVVGRTMDELFLDFVYDMNRQRALNTVYNYKIDPHTGEPAEFFNNMGLIMYQGITYNIAAGTPVPVNTSRNTLPWSFFFIEPMLTEDDYVFNFTTGFILGKSFISLVKGR